MRKILTGLSIVAALFLSIAPVFVEPAHAAAGIFASGGGTVTAGERFTVTVKASGTTFDSLQGTISVSGPVEIVSFSPGSATWLPGKSPANGQQFVGIASATNSLVVARITLRGTKEGSGSVSVGGVKLASKGAIVGTDGGSTSFKINRALQVPGTVKVSSASHPDQNEAYAVPTVELSWDKPSGVTAFSYVFDQDSNTTPAAKETTAETSAKFENQAVGTYYFHIRAKNGDGWGGTTHFKVTIKEPDPTINDTLVKPVIAKIEKLENFQTDLEAGTLTGIVISGTGQPDYTLNLSVTPSFGELPAEALSTKIDTTGNWQLTFEQPLKAGFYTLTAQAQLDKTLSPVSDPVKVELSLAKGGNVQFITVNDAVPSPVPTPTPTPTATVLGLKRSSWVVIGVALLALLATGAVGLIIRQRNKYR